MRKNVESETFTIRNSFSHVCAIFLNFQKIVEVSNIHAKKVFLEMWHNIPFSSSRRSRELSIATRAVCEYVVVKLSMYKYKIQLSGTCTNSTFRFYFAYFVRQINVNQMFVKNYIIYRYPWITFQKFKRWFLDENKDELVTYLYKQKPTDASSRS